MFVYLVPYEQVHLSVLMTLDEATEITDALEILKSVGKASGLAASAGKLQLLLNTGITRAAAYQARKGTS